MSTGRSVLVAISHANREARGNHQDVDCMDLHDKHLEINVLTDCRITDLSGVGNGNL